MGIGSIGPTTTAYQPMGTYASALSGVYGTMGFAGDVALPGTLGATGSTGVETTTGSVEDGGKVSPSECQTCKERKYIDGSDENVSFKSASHISPQSAGTAVRAHEGEHVSNAYDKAAQNDGTVVNASVSIHTSVCPECGRTYVSGGTTHTTIRYNTATPYGANQKSSDAASLIGANVDLAV